MYNHNKGNTADFVEFLHSLSFFFIPVLQLVSLYQVNKRLLDYAIAINKVKKGEQKKDENNVIGDDSGLLMKLKNYKHPHPPLSHHLPAKIIPAPDI